MNEITAPWKPSAFGFAEISAIGRLHWWLAQEIAAARKRSEELVIEIIAVGDDNNRRILHRGMKDDASR